MGMSGAEMLFVAKCLVWRLEKPEVRTITMCFAHYGLHAYLHGEHGVCESVWIGEENGIERVTKLIEEKEREAECQTEETCEDQKLVISSDAEQNGITVGTSD